MVGDKAGMRIGIGMVYLNLFLARFDRDEDASADPLQGFRSVP
jgi:hypothetical protein